MVQGMLRWLAIWCWAMLTWTLLTWTATVEQVSAGIILSALVATACRPLGEVAGPWRVLSPRRLVALCRLGAVLAARVVVANLRVARLVWSPRAEPPSGMVIVPTRMRGDGELAAVTVLTSVVVDSQLVDLDRERHELQYHAIWADPDPGESHRRINAPVEAPLEGVTR